MAKLKSFSVDQLSCLQHLQNQSQDRPPRQQQQQNRLDETTRNMSSEDSKRNHLTTRNVSHQKPQQQQQHRRSSSLLEPERREEPTSSPKRGARRELFARTSREEPQNQTQNASKWWRPCWNGEQLDGELLFEQVRARQERRLMMASDPDEGGPRQSEQSSGSSQAPGVVYAVPRASLVNRLSLIASSPESGKLVGETFSARPLNCSSGESSSPEAPLRVSTRAAQREWRRNAKMAESESSSSATTSPMLDDEDPLSDPLYASVLGTSKQLQAMAGQRRHQQQRAAGPSRVSRLDEGQDHDKGTTASGQRHDEMNSLVASCLEVQRATRNGNLLLLIGQEEKEQVSSHEDRLSSSLSEFNAAVSRDEL
jgi:hypothetical protein